MNTTTKRPAADTATTGKRLGGIGRIIPGKVEMSTRGWLRACDAGLAPWGVKIGARRLWDLDEVDQWIADGCPRCR